MSCRTRRRSYVEISPWPPSLAERPGCSRASPPEFSPWAMESSLGEALKTPPIQSRPLLTVGDSSPEATRRAMGSSKQKFT